MGYGRGWHSCAEQNSDTDGTRGFLYEKDMRHMGEHTGTMMADRETRIGTHVFISIRYGQMGLTS